MRLQQNTFNFETFHFVRGQVAMHFLFKTHTLLYNIIISSVTVRGLVAVHHPPVLVRETAVKMGDPGVAAEMRDLEVAAEVGGLAAAVLPNPLDTIVAPIDLVEPIVIREVEPGVGAGAEVAQTDITSVARDPGVGHQILIVHTAAAGGEEEEAVRNLQTGMKMKTF